MADPANFLNILLIIGIFICQMNINILAIFINVSSLILLKFTLNFVKYKKIAAKPKICPKLQKIALITSDILFVISFHDTKS